MTARDSSAPLRRAGDENLLIIADSESSSDLYYATQFLVGDPLIYLELDSRKILLVSDLELGRAQEQASVDEVVASSPYENRLRDAGERVRLSAVADLFLKDAGVRELVVPYGFPLGHAEHLQSLGYELRSREDPLFPERVVKAPHEIEALRQSQTATEEAMAFVIDTIRQSEIRGDLLYRQGDPLTSEWLRREAHKLLLECDLQASQTIIAGGDQGCDPHQRGYGPLPANQTIIIDIFPRSLRTRYWGDMTRTVVRGRASDAARKLWGDVHEAVEMSIAKLRAGVDGRDIHLGIVEFFASRGNETGERDGKKNGFIHSTGHGVGLDIHESPKIGRSQYELRAGHVVTVEPGLYYHGIGAVRLEDLVLIEEDGCQNLNRFPKELEI